MAQSKDIQRYITSEGRVPFTEWLESLRDQKTKGRIQARLERVGLGNFGDCKSVGEGVFELRLDFGSGYRVYFGQVGSIVVLLLLGGDKTTQEQDIRKAKEYWTDYEERQSADE